jgi:hypothetical protein
LRSEPVSPPTGRDVLDYIRALWNSQCTPNASEAAHVQRMKKFMNYIGEGVPGNFLHEIRRVETEADFFRVCREFLDHDQQVKLEPHEIPP